MPKGKLILICQSGGEFKTNGDGSLSYTGGDAYALDINPETLFDDLKLKLAEMCNVDYNSLAIKYFLPGNRRTLITLGNDKDLKRMYDFHGDSVTADVFVTGQKGFDRDAFHERTMRLCGIKAAERVTAVVPYQVAAAPSRVAAAPSQVAAAPSRLATPRSRASARPSRAATAAPSRVAAATPSRVAAAAPSRAAAVRSQAAAAQSEDVASPVVLGLTTTPIRAFPAAAANRPVSSPDTRTAVNAKGQRPTRDPNAIKKRRRAKNPSAVKKKSRTKDPSAVENQSHTEDAGAARDTPTDQIVVAAQATADSSTIFDLNASPADTVKKRRRTASWKFGANGPTITSVADNTDEMTEDSSQKGNDWDNDTDTENDWNNETDSETGDVQRQPNPVSANGATRARKSTARKSKLRKKSDRYSYSAPEADVVEYNAEEPYDSLDKMVASWKKGIRGVGQKFKNVAEFRDALQKYAIAHRFAYKLKKNDTSRASGICVVEGCSWKIHASWVQSEEAFKIKNLNKSHTCGGESWKGAHPAKSWLVNIIKGRLRENPHCKPRVIANSISRDFGMQLNYGQVRRGIEEARQQLLGSYKESYDQLPWFCDKIMESNPGSFAKLVVSDDKKFQRLFVSFEASIHGFLNGCRPILFLDSTTLRSKYHEMLLMATAVDGDDTFFPVSFAVVDVENDDNWRWFLEQLSMAISTSRAITFVSDNEKGLMKLVLEVFENAYHGYSIYHLGENLKRNLRGPFYGDGKSSLIGSLIIAAQSARLDGYKMFAEQIKMISPKTYEWLMQIEPEYWTNALFQGENYNQVTVDAAELYNNWIEEVQEQPIMQKLEALRNNIMELIDARRVASNSWASKFTPSKEQKLQEETLTAHYLKVLFSSDTLFEVHDNSIHVVNLEKQECSCMMWKFTGLPCCHALAVFLRTGRSVYDYCSKYFTVDCYRLTYLESINPVLAISNPLDDGKAASETPEVLPPATTPRPATQQKEKSTRPQKEVKRIMTCSRCKGEGHNKASCKDNLDGIVS